MMHRKETHRPIQCLRFLKNMCYYTSEKCWYEHRGEVKEHNPENLVEMNEAAQTEEEPAPKLPVFRLPPGNLAPPATPTTTTPKMTQATWIKMTSMMSELRQMMENLKQFQQ